MATKAVGVEIEEHLHEVMKDHQPGGQGPESLQ